MSLITGRSQWVLLLSTNGNPESRHIFDIAYGIMSIEY